MYMAGASLGAICLGVVSYNMEYVYLIWESSSAFHITKRMNHGPSSRQRMRIEHMQHSSQQQQRNIITMTHQRYEAKPESRVRE